MAKVTRKLKKKLFSALPRTENPFIRNDLFGRSYDFNQYGMSKENGWFIVENEIKHWSEVCTNSD